MKLITKKNEVYYKQDVIRDKPKNFYVMKIKLMANELDFLHFYFYYKNKQIYYENIKFIDLNADVIFITRTALTDNSSTLKVIQKSRLKDNGPGSLPDDFQDSEIQYPLTVVNKELFIKTLSKKYMIICEIEEDRDVHEINGQSVNQYGFLCIRK